MKSQMSDNSIAIILGHLKVMNLTVLLFLTVLFLITARFIYKFLDYIPQQSVYIFLAVTALLLGAFYGISRIIAQQAIRSIESYGSKISSVMSMSRDVQTIQHSDILIENILDTAVRLSDADGGTLFLTNDDEIEFKVVRGANAEKLQGVRIPRETGIVGWVIKEGLPVRIEDAKQDARHFSKIDEQTEYETRSILTVPLLFSQRAAGALQLVKSVPSHFTKDDEELLQYFAGQAVLAMSNSLFREDMKNVEMHMTNVLVEAVDNISDKRGHLRMVAKYSLLIGRGIEMTEEEMERLYRAAILHDIGFLRIDQGGIKTLTEYQAHAEKGFEILRVIPFYQDIASFVRHHHERFDGTGYPSGLKGEMIPIISRIIGIAETFDVMTNEFSFKMRRNGAEKKIPPGTAGFRKALIELKQNAGTQFDPRLVEVFLGAVSEEDIISSQIERYTNRYAAIMNAPAKMDAV